MPRISSIKALEILDSRGRPTIKAYVELSNGIKGAASVPSGASTGKAEAHELRDADPARYQGKGCFHAVGQVNGPIAECLEGRSMISQQEWDRTLTILDGTPDKSRLGANAILAVSLAYARTVAIHQNFPLYGYLNGLVPFQEECLPQLTVNLFSGGKHAGGQMPIQDVLIVPISAPSIQAALRDVQAVYQAAVQISRKKYGSRWLTADEGGLAPPFTSIESMFEDALQAIEQAGLKPGQDVSLALDVAASHFYVDEKYHIGNQILAGEELIEILRSWIDKYPIISLEDGLEEEDWDNWSLLKKGIGDRCLVLGDDLLCTQTKRIQKAIDMQAANALLLKVNQVGTLTEAAAAFQLAKSHGWRVTVSARSGETEDNWLADLAVGWGGDQIKVGSITQSERLAKYNRLLEIEATWDV